MAGATSDARVRDRERLVERFPEQSVVERLWRELPIHEYEGLCARAMSYSSALRQSLLVDLSNLIPARNGTTEAILGILLGLNETAADWRVSLLVPPEVVGYHALKRLAPAFEYQWPEPHGRSSATLTPLQPWSLDDIVRVHRYGLFNFFLMYDTILDDIAPERVSGLERVWGLLARRADGLLFASNYTMQRMRARFTVDSKVEEHVLHLATEPSEYCLREYAPAPTPYVFVVGNDYPHKWMARTVQDLSAAFPYLHLKTLGYDNAELVQVEGLPSGNVPDEAVHRLYAQSRVVVSQVSPEPHSLPTTVQSGSHSFEKSLQTWPDAQLVAVQGSSHRPLTGLHTSVEAHSWPGSVQLTARHAFVCWSHTSPAVRQSSSVTQLSSQALRSG